MISMLFHFDIEQNLHLADKAGTCSLSPLSLVQLRYLRALLSALWMALADPNTIQFNANVDNENSPHLYNIT